MTIRGWCIVAVLLGCCCWGAWANVGLRWTFLGILGYAVIGTMFLRRYFRHLRAERLGESICTFARQVSARSHDTWVVRAVYEEVSRHVGVPIRPSDRFAKELRMADEDMEDIAVEVARRAGRSLNNSNTNPFFGKVKTVADMVAFLENQPLANCA